MIGQRFVDGTRHSQPDAAGQRAARVFDPQVEDAYWRQHYADRPYAKEYSYGDLSPAYFYGGHAAATHQGRTYDNEAVRLEEGWDSSLGRSRLLWHDAKDAVRDGWQRVEAAQNW